MASITSFNTGVPAVFSWGEEFDWQAFRLTLKMGSTQAISSSAESDTDLKFLAGSIANDTQYNALYSGKVPRSMVGHGEGNQYTGQLTFTVPQNDFGISKGGSKTFTYDGTIFGFESPGSAADHLTSTQTVWQYLESILGELPERSAIPISLMMRVFEYSGSHRDYSAYVANVATFLTQRINPVIDTYVESDAETHDIYSELGVYAQGKSRPKMTVGFTLDPLDPTLTAVTTWRIYRDNVLYREGSTVTGAGVETAAVELDPFQDTGEYTYELEVTDSAGNTATEDGTFTVIAYQDPTITKLGGTEFLQRYSVVVDEYGHETYYADELGENIWVNLHGVATAMDGINECYITLRDESTGVSTVLYHGTDGMNVTKTNDRTLVTGTYQSGIAYLFTLYVSDFYHTGSDAIMVDTVTIEKGSGYFDVNTNGVAVGMLSTATENNKKFESAYPAYFYGGIVGGVKYESGIMQNYGTWIDGSEIRCAVLTGTTSNTGRVEIGQLNDFAGLLKAYGYIVVSTRYYQLPRVSRDSISNNVGVSVSNTGSCTLEIGTGNTGSKQYCCVVEYIVSNND